jgi:hypothetical protein
MSTSPKMTTCDCCNNAYDIHALTDHHGEWLCSDCEEQLGVKEEEDKEDEEVCPCVAEHEDDDKNCEKCGHRHSCEENHCEDCLRGKFCNCDDKDCPYCKILRKFPDAREMSVKWWDNQV